MFEIMQFCSDFMYVVTDNYMAAPYALPIILIF
jgi:hypothetical protein